MDFVYFSLDYFHHTEKRVLFRTAAKIMTNRYQKQIILPEIGREGQISISATSILVIGAGGLGCPALPYLAGAGFGQITIMDGDSIERGNLHRQILYKDSQEGQNKAEAAAQYCRTLNPEIDVKAIPESLSAQNAQKIIQGHDIVLDGTDNFDAKFLINDVCVKNHIPLILAAVQGWEGQCAVFAPHIAGGCYRCYLPDSPQNTVINCNESGVIGPLAGILGCLQASEAIKLAANSNLDSLLSRLYFFDLRSIKTMIFDIPKNIECSICSKDRDRINISEDKYAQNFTHSEIIEINDPVLEHAVFIDVRETEEWNAGHIKNAKHFPLSRLINSPELFNDLTGQGPYVLYCQKGIRSLQALRILKSYGFSDLYSLACGYENWPRKNTS